MSNLYVLMIEPGSGKIGGLGCLMNFKELLKVGLVGGVVLCLMAYWRHGLTGTAPASVALVYAAGFVYFSTIHMLLAGYDRLRGKTRVH